MNYYLIKIGNLHYGKHNENGRIIDFRYLDYMGAYYLIKEIGYKSKKRCRVCSKATNERKRAYKKRF